MSNQQPNTGTAPLPSFQQVANFLGVMQSSLGAYVQCEARYDETGKAQASARVMGAYRKILASYETLPPESQAEMLEPLRSLHETIVALGIPLGPLRLPEPSAAPVASPEAPAPEPDAAE